MLRTKLKDFIIAFDFDQTIVGKSPKWPTVGHPREQMIDLINFLYDHGFRIVINSLRDVDSPTNKPYILMRRFLADKGVKFDLVNSNFDYEMDQFNSNPRKISCDLNVDDTNTGGVPEPKEICKEVITRWATKIMEDRCILPNQEIDGDFIDAYVEKYLTGTTIRRTIRPEDE
jgi:hypothetical protein